MARRPSRRRIVRSARTNRRAAAAPRARASRSVGARARRSAARPRNPTVRVVIQQAPDLSNVQVRGAVSMETAKKARF